MTKHKDGRSEQVKDLMETVEAIRKERFPSVPAALVERMLDHHTDAAATEIELLREVEELVNATLSSETDGA